MHNMRVWTAALIIGGVLIIGFALSVPHVRDLGKRTSPVAASSTPMVYLHDAYKKGTHTITGKVAVANLCTTVSASASTESSTTIIIALDIPSDSGVCLAEPATTTFSATASASAGATLIATINGTNASTTPY